jgi:ABC-type Fe3+-hydroxamate transport system substrate-binding protein
MKLKLITATLLAASLLSACSGNSSEKGNASKEKQPSDMKEMVQDYSANKSKDQNASITSEQLIVTDKGGKETVYDLPKDEFFVSIAPYNDQTHP